VIGCSALCDPAKKSAEEIDDGNENNGEQKFLRRDRVYSDKFHAE
jgi:hypothetical protein